MTIEQDFLPFATAGGANVLTQSAYAALGALTNGFSTGIAPSNACNKAWRQSSIMSAVIGDFIVAQTGQTVIDDGTTATILANFTAAVQASAGGGEFYGLSAASDQSTGTVALFGTAFTQLGSNFSYSGGNIQATAAGTYDVTVCLRIAMTNTETFNLYFVPSAGTVYGPTSGTPQVTELGASNDTAVLMKCRWVATAGATINVTSGTAFGVGGATIRKGSTFNITQG